jgi:hypothetical protein
LRSESASSSATPSNSATHSKSISVSRMPVRCLWPQICSSSRQSSSFGVFVKGSVCLRYRVWTEMAPSNCGNNFPIFLDFSGWTQLWFVILIPQQFSTVSSWFLFLFNILCWKILLTICNLWSPTFLNLFNFCCTHLKIGPFLKYVCYGRVPQTWSNLIAFCPTNPELLVLTFIGLGFVVFDGIIVF